MSIKREWIVMHCLDAWHDAQGNRGEHKIPLGGYDEPMTRAEALAALQKIEASSPQKDFSIRKIAAVVDLKR